VQERATRAAGAPWHDAPECSGPWQTLSERFARWTDDDAWERLRRTLLAAMQRQHRLAWSLCCVDGSSARALTAAAGARKKKRGRRAGPSGDTSPAITDWGVPGVAGGVSCISRATVRARS